MYRKYIKRMLDFFIAMLGLLVISPLLLILIILGGIAMKGNPFFIQKRPGKNEKIFQIVKFRTMSNVRDRSGMLLPDELRMNAYGKFIRITSLDELPELINILKGDMSLVGPRPLLVEYLPRYNAQQRRRHEVRPGVTGLAQVHGRNSISWEKKFQWDVKYVDNITFKGDLKIIFKTIIMVLKHEGINSDTSATMEDFMGSDTKTKI